MLTLEQAVTIQILHQQSKSIKAITRELGVSRNTVRNLSSMKYFSFLASFGKLAYLDLSNKPL